MKYCKNCERENDKSCNYTIKKQSEKFGEVVHSIRGCGREQMEYRENEHGYSFIPFRNKDNNCPAYKRKWWKFYIKEL